MTELSSQIGVSTHSSKTNNDMWESRERYTIHFCKTNNKGVGIGEEKMQLKVPDLFIFAIQRYSHFNGITDELKSLDTQHSRSMIMHLTIQ